MTTVAVCVPTVHRRSEMLDRALNSVDAQTRKVDDVVLTTDERREGAAATRNRAWRQANTEWVAFLDDDDELLPQHVETCLRVADQTSADLVYPWFTIRDGAGNDLPNRDPLRVKVADRFLSPLGLPFGDWHVRHLREHGNFIPVTVLVRRARLEEVGGFPQPSTPDWPHPDCEDWGLWRRLLDVGATFAHAPEVTWIWNWHGNNTSGRADQS